MGAGTPPPNGARAWAWRSSALLALSLLVACVPQRAAVDSSDARAAQARVGLLDADPLKHPRALADAEVQRLSSWRDALTLRLRATEDRLLVVIKKSANYDVAASEAVAALQDKRLLLHVALRQLEERRRQRAQALVDGVAATMPVAATATAAGDAGEDDSLEALLQHAQALLDEGKDDEAGFHGLSLSMMVGAADTAAAPRRQRAPVRAEKKDFGSDDVEAGAKDGKAWAGESPPPPPAGGRGGFDKDQPLLVAAAAVMVPSDPGMGLVSALRRKLPRMRACIPDEQLQTGIHFTVRARLAADGRVRGARLSGSHGLSPSAAACVVSVLTSVRLPRGGAARVVSVPLQLGG